jgi:hypothetical protein
VKLARVKREAKQVPALVFAIESWEKQLAATGKAAGKNLLKDAKRASIRDFKIKQREGAEQMAAPAGSGGRGGNRSRGGGRGSRGGGRSSSGGGAARSGSSRGAGSSASAAAGSEAAGEDEVMGEGEEGDAAEGDQE